MGVVMADRIQVSKSGNNVYVFQVYGELGSFDDITRLIDRISDEGDQVVILDLSHVFVDESQVHVLRDVYAWALARNTALVAIDPFRMLHSLRYILTFGSIEEATDSVKSGGVPIPIQVYLDDESAAKGVESALRGMLRRFDVHSVEGPPPVLGSWYRQLFGWLWVTRGTAIAAELERAVEIQLVDRYQAGIDSSASDSIATLIAALEKTPGAVIQAGSVLLVKYHETVIVRQLTPIEMVFWHQNPALFKDPSKAMAALQLASSQGESAFWHSHDSELKNFDV
jgi:hypothetical protein